MLAAFPVTSCSAGCAGGEYVGEPTFNRAYPDQQLHLVMDNYAARKRIEIRDWLAPNPCVRCTPRTRA
jgi:hypothetical protein